MGDGASSVSASSVSDTYTSTGGTDAVFTALSLTMDAALSLLSCMISAAVGAFAFALTHETFSLSSPSSANASSSKSIAWDVSSSRARRSRSSACFARIADLLTGSTASSSMPLTHSKHATRSVKKLNSQGSAAPSTANKIAPKGYTAGLARASTMALAGTANFVGAAHARGSNRDVLVRRKQTCLSNTNNSPESNGFSPLQHAYTPRKRSCTSVSLNVARATAASAAI